MSPPADYAGVRLLHRQRELLERLRGELVQGGPAVLADLAALLAPPCPLGRPDCLCSGPGPKLGPSGGVLLGSAVELSLLLSLRLLHAILARASSGHILSLTVKKPGAPGR